MRTIFGAFLFCLLLITSAKAQEKLLNNLDSPAIGSVLPSFRIRLLDGETIVDTKTIDNKKPTIFILFSPDCKHCSDIVKSLTAQLPTFDSVNLCLLSTPMPMEDIRSFATLNKLLLYDQITVGQDVDFFFGSFFKANTVPFVAVYDKQKKLFTIIKNLKEIDELKSIILQVQ